MLEAVPNESMETEEIAPRLTHHEAVLKWIRENPFMDRFDSIDFSDWHVDHTTEGFDPAALVPLAETAEEAA